MKNLVSVLLLIALAALPLQADNVLQNSDFANGTDHWRGNGRTPADMSSDDPFAKPDPLLSSGLIIPLKERQWTMVTQNFRTKATQLILKIVMVFAPGVTFSDRDEDYLNVSDKLNYDIFAPFNIDKNHWVAQFVDYADQTKGFYFTFPAQNGDTKAVTFHANVTDLSPLEDELVTIGFPPGQGNIILQNVELNGNDQ